MKIAIKEDDFALFCEILQTQNVIGSNLGSHIYEACKHIYVDSEIKYFLYRYVIDKKCFKFKEYIVFESDDKYMINAFNMYKLYILSETTFMFDNEYSTRRDLFEMFDSILKYKSPRVFNILSVFYGCNYELSYCGITLDRLNDKIEEQLYEINNAVKRLEKWRDEY